MPDGPCNRKTERAKVGNNLTYPCSFLAHPGLILTYFTARSNLVPYAFVWEKGKTMDFSETIVVYHLKLATDDQSDKKFLLTSKLCPLGGGEGGCMPPAWGYIHVLNHKKKNV